MGLIPPNPGRSIADGFWEKILNYCYSAREERHLVGPEPELLVIVYLQWLIYSAPGPFKSPDQGGH